MKSVAIFLIVLSAAVSAFAQDAPKAEVFGGYQYLSLDTRGGSLSRRAFNGWNVDGAYRVWKKLSIVADFGAGYKQIPIDVDGLTFNVRTRVYSMLFGPRVSTTSHNVTLFAEGLVGLAHESAAVSGIVSESSNRFAMGGGGGFDVKLTRRLALRLGKCDYLLIRDGANLNNLRFSTGMIFKF